MSDAPFDSIPYSVLNARNALSDPDHILKMRCLVQGGKLWRQHLDWFICCNPGEPQSLTADRRKQFFYTNETGPMVNYSADSLFQKPPILRALNDGGELVQDVPSYYATLQEDVDGQGTSVTQFMKARAKEAMTSRLAWVRLVNPQTTPEDLDLDSLTIPQFDDLNLGDEIRASYILAENVLDWEADSDGLAWAITYDCQTPRLTPAMSRKIKVETWTILDRAFESTYQITYDPDKNPPSDNTPIPLIRKTPHSFPRTPLICIDFDRQSVDLIADTQIDKIHLDNAAAWAVKRMCFPMVVFGLKDPDVPPRIDKGTAVIIGEKDTVKTLGLESIPLDKIQAMINAKKDDLYREWHQQAQGVDNNAAAIGRSADSKQADFSSTDVVHEAMALILRAKIEEIFQLISDARRDSITWSCEPSEALTTTDQNSVLAMAKSVKALNIPSKTLQKELDSKIATVALPHLSSDTHRLIRSEIEDGHNAETIAMPVDPEQLLDSDKEDQNQTVN